MNSSAAYLGRQRACVFRGAFQRGDGGAAALDGGTADLDVRPVAATAPGTVQRSVKVLQLGGHTAGHGEREVAERHGGLGDGFGAVIDAPVVLIEVH